MPRVSIRSDLRCGDLGEIVALHGRLYESLPGFGLRFEAYVARTIAEFILDNDARGRVWLAEHEGVLVGCVAIALRDNDTAQLRWVLVDSQLRGQGLGRRLVEHALAYSRKHECRSVFLETTDGLPESQGLYEALGFDVEYEGVETLWDGERRFYRMRLEFN